MKRKAESSSKKAGSKKPKTCTSLYSILQPLWMSLALLGC